MKNKTLKELKILFVEDEENLSRLVKNAIGENFHTFAIAKDGLEGLELFEKIKPDIVITDIMMPRMNGLEMAKKLKELNDDCFIIILSAFSEKEKLLGAIDVGVAKYFLKPYDIDELLEYLNSIAYKFFKKNLQLVDGFTFSKNTCRLYKNDRFAQLTKNEIKFLSMFAENQNEIIDDETIKKNLWGNESSDERLRTFIKRIREKTSKNIIKNIKGVGYKLNTML